MELSEIRLRLYVAAIAGGHELEDIAPFVARAEQHILGGEEAMVEASPAVAIAPTLAAKPAAPVLPEAPLLPTHLARVLKAVQEGLSDDGIHEITGYSVATIVNYRGKLRRLGLLPPAHRRDAAKPAVALPSTQAPLPAPPAAQAQPLKTPEALSPVDRLIVAWRQKGQNAMELAGRFSLTIPEMNQRLRRLERDGFLPRDGIG
ncbi:MAG: hypothetical protein KBC46_03370 [Ferrovibrio sp.]|nr:hypothetical protein [Ferrovibrio sp.]